jgi:hypothetical protein
MIFWLVRARRPLTQARAQCTREPSTSARECAGIYDLSGCGTTRMYGLTVFHPFEKR